VTIVRITAGLLRLYAPRQDGDAVPALLAMPDHAIARVPDRSFRKLLLRRFQLLQADDVGQRLL
jgi:hypothetical protein